MSPAENASRNQHSNVGPGVGPPGVAIGVAVVLVGLIVSPRVIAPLGGAIALAAAIAWLRSGRPKTPPKSPPPAPEAATGEQRFPRSRLLERATLGAAGLVALGVSVPVAGFALLPSFVGRRRAVDLGPLAAFPEGQFVVATFLSDPQAGEVSRRAAYVRNNGLAGGAPSFTIMSSRCTHVGCPTQPDGPVYSDRHRLERTSTGEVGLVPTLPAGGFGCPCHGSQFDVEGNRTAGPAVRALDRYEFSIRNGRLVLGRLYSVSRVDGAGAGARIHAFALKGAGEPATGPASLLYPLDPAA
jgi:Rieske Fe-S protein